MSGEGKKQTALYRQSKKDIQPLIKKLKKRDVGANERDLFMEMIELCLKRDYRLAESKYIALTVGNAAWPVGQTSVGIHERAGRSKISADRITHTLNDDTTRKYMQVFKRLMGHMSKVLPPDDASQRVNV